MTRVWVLLFESENEQEGIYSIKVNDENLIIAFVDEDDAIRYGMMLEAQDFMSPKTEVIPLRELEEFCDDGGYRLRVIEPNELMTPPQQNLDETDWQAGNELDSMRSQLERLLRIGLPNEGDDL